MSRMAGQKIAAAAGKHPKNKPDRDGKRPFPGAKEAFERKSKSNASDPDD